MVLTTIFIAYKIRTAPYKGIFFFQIGLLVVTSFAGCVTAYRWNVAMHIPDTLMYFVFSIALSSFDSVLTMIPPMVIISKCIPPGIEGTMSSILMTILFICTIFEPLFGNYVNTFVGVTKEDMSNYPILTLIVLLTNMIPLVLIPFMVPSNEQVE